MKKPIKIKEDRASKILYETCLMISEEGLSGVSVQALAKRIGCSVGTIYNSYENLDELIMCANSITLIDLGKALEVTRSSVLKGDPLKRLLMAARIYLDFGHANSRRWAAVFEHRLAEGYEIPDWHRLDHERLFLFIREPLGDLRPDLSDDELNILARSLFSGVHGIVSLGRQVRLKALPIEVIWQQIELIVTAFVKGFKEKP